MLSQIPLRKLMKNKIIIYEPTPEKMNLREFILNTIENLSSEHRENKPSIWGEVCVQCAFSVHSECIQSVFRIH